MNTYLIIAIIFICLIFEALYSGSEIALIASDINRIKFFARRGSFSAGQAVKTDGEAGMVYFDDFGRN